jgi:hypothetical protein
MGNAPGNILAAAARAVGTGAIAVALHFLYKGEDI